MFYQISMQYPAADQELKIENRASIEYCCQSQISLAVLFKDNILHHGRSESKHQKRWPSYSTSSNFIIAYRSMFQEGKIKLHKMKKKLGIYGISYSKNIANFMADCWWHFI